MKAVSEASTLSRSELVLLAELKELIQRVAPGATVLLYGSVARGEQGAESDYDVLALTDAPLSPQEENALLDAIYEWQLEQDVIVSPLFYSRNEWDDPIRRVSPFRKEVERDAVIL